VGLRGELGRNTFPAYSKERATTRCRGAFEIGRDRMSGSRAEGTRFDVLLWLLADLQAHLMERAAKTDSLTTLHVLSGAYGGLDGLCVCKFCDSRRKGTSYHHV
jgi:hypothetical protein